MLHDAAALTVMTRVAAVVEPATGNRWPGCGAGFGAAGGDERAGATRRVVRGPAAGCGAARRVAFGACGATDRVVGPGCDAGAVELADAPRRGGHDTIGAEAVRLGSEYGVA
ncbi:MAG: hypothetical protein ABI808_04260 [Pseudonocardiales bacterium]